MSTPEERSTGDEKLHKTTLDIVTLLTTPERDFLVRNNGDQVPVSELKGKVVGLFFYSTYLSNYCVDKLRQLYIALKKMKENFEMVFICVSSNRNNEVKKKTFMKHFTRKDVPWLALPFTDGSTKSHRKLHKIFSTFDPDGNVDDRLVIVSPDDNICHTRAMDIIKKYGIGAYPFTLEKLTHLEIARLKSLTLHSILFSGIYDHVFGNQGQKIPASDLVGKKILLFLTTTVSAPDCSCSAEVMNKKVSTWYNEIKQKDEAFEMIRVFRSHDPIMNSKSNYYGKFPWLEFPYNKVFSQKLFEKSLKVESPMLVAFGSDGRFITRKDVIQLISDGNDQVTPDFFDDDEDDLFEEIHKVIVRENHLLAQAQAQVK